MTSSDNRIIRYLKSISEKTTKASSVFSYHFIVLHEPKNLRVRFSNHISTSAFDIDIVILDSQTYLIRTKYITKHLQIDPLIKYLKAIILVYDEYEHELNAMNEARKGLVSINEKKFNTFVNNIKKLETSILKKDQEIAILKNQLSTLEDESEFVKLDAKYKLLNSQCLDFQSKLSFLKETINKFTL